MSRSKAKGTAFEREVVDFLRGHGFPAAERRAMEGVNDRGDVAGIPGVVVECKNHRDIDLGGFMGELEAEQARAAAPVGLLVVKRRMKPVARAYAVMTLDQASALLRDETTP